MRPDGSAHDPRCRGDQPEKSIVEASRLLIQHDIRRLPVVEGKKLVASSPLPISSGGGGLEINEIIEPYLRRRPWFSGARCRYLWRIDMEFAAVELPRH